MTMSVFAQIITIEKKDDVTPARGFSLLYLLFVSCVFHALALYAFFDQSDGQGDVGNFRTFDLEYVPGYPLRNTMAVGAVRNAQILPLMIWMLLFRNTHDLYPQPPPLQRLATAALDVVSVALIVLFIYWSVRRYHDLACFLTFRGIYPGKRVLLLLFYCALHAAYYIAFEDRLFILSLIMITVPVVILLCEFLFGVLEAGIESESSEIIDWLRAFRFGRLRRALACCIRCASCLCRDKTAPQILYT